MKQGGLILSRSARFGLFYAAFYLAFGAYLPYMPIWYEAHGLNPEMIGLAIGASMIGRVFMAPLAAMIADNANKRRNVLFQFSLLTMVLFALHVFAQSTALIVILAFIAGGALTAAIPITDAWAMNEATRRKFTFGIPRAIGSGAFILANLGGGVLIGYFGGKAALYWIIAACLLCVLTALILPEGRRQGVRTKVNLTDIYQVLRYNGLPWVLAGSAFIQGAHGFYYGFSAVAWTHMGFSSQGVGLLWALAVGSEIVFFALAGRYFSKVSPLGLMILGGGVSILRWILLAMAPPFWVLVMLQSLHAFSFGATYFGFLQYANQNVPERYSATVQALHSALSGGLVLAAATYASGFAFSKLGIAGFSIMVIPALFGLVCALRLALSPFNNSIRS